MLSPSLRRPSRGSAFATSRLSRGRGGNNTSVISASETGQWQMPYLLMRTGRRSVVARRGRIRTAPCPRFGLSANIAMAWAKGGLMGIGRGRVSMPSVAVHSTLWRALTAALRGPHRRRSRHRVLGAREELVSLFFEQVVAGYGVWGRVGGEYRHEVVPGDTGGQGRCGRHSLPDVTVLSYTGGSARVWWRKHGTATYAGLGSVARVSSALSCSKTLMTARCQRSRGR